MDRDGAADTSLRDRVRRWLPTPWRGLARTAGLASLSRILMGFLRHARSGVEGYCAFAAGPQVFAAAAANMAAELYPAAADPLPIVGRLIAKTNPMTRRTAASGQRRQPA